MIRNYQHQNRLIRIRGGDANLMIITRNWSLPFICLSAFLRSWSKKPLKILVFVQTTFTRSSIVITLSISVPKFILCRAAVPISCSQQVLTASSLDVVWHVSQKAATMYNILYCCRYPNISKRELRMWTDIGPGTILRWINYRTVTSSRKKLIPCLMVCLNGKIHT